MLPKTKRLTAQEVREVLKLGKPVRAGAVSARYTVGTAALPEQASKAAVVVSTKVARSAVARNKLRRLGYAALTTLPARTHLVVFIQSKDVTPADIATLCSKLSS